MPKICKVDGCNRTDIHARGFCNKHYLQHKKKDKSRTLCKVDGCNAPMIARGLCSLHYSRVLRTGGTKPKIKTRTGITKRYKREHKSWSGAKSRCYNPNCATYQYYGGRGIKVCNEWLGPNGFATFLQDMGPKPGPEYSLDRIDPNGDYCPENCRWADKWTQSANRRAKSNTGMTGIHYLESTGCWLAYATVNGSMAQRKFKNKEDAIRYREQLMLRVLSNDDNFVRCGIQV